MPTRAPTLLACAIGASLAACGTTEESGDVGETLSAKGVRATVERVDTSVPANAGDVTGLSRPSPGSKLVAAARFSWSVAGS